MASKNQQDRQGQIDTEKLTKKVRRLEAKERELNGIIIVEQGNMETIVSAIRTFAVHANAHCQEIRDELATYTDEDITAAEAVCTELEGEADTWTESFPVGWPNA